MEFWATEGSPADGADAEQKGAWSFWTGRVHMVTADFIHGIMRLVPCSTEWQDFHTKESLHLCKRSSEPTWTYTVYVLWG